MAKEKAEVAEAPKVKEPRKPETVDELLTACRKQYGKNAIFTVSSDRVVVQVKDKPEDVSPKTHVHVLGK
jgi:hypothetical protein